MRRTVDNYQVIIVTLVGLILRLVTFFVFEHNTAGDPQTRAMQAYHWGLNPHVIDHGYWLPGWAYISGIFNIFYANPFFSTRLLNVFIGTLTIPVFYALVRRVFCARIALFSALLLAFLPLHIGLSASSLTEPSYLLWFATGAFLMIVAAEKPHFWPLLLMLSCLFIVLAGMTRYEAWILFPLIPFYYFYRTRHIIATVLIVFILMSFPIYWMYGNYHHFNNALYSFTRANSWDALVGDYALNYIGGLKVLGDKFLYHLGWMASIMAMIGVGYFFSRPKKIRIQQYIYVAILLVSWAVMIRFAMARGVTFSDRFLLFGFVFLLPFTLLPLVHFWNSKSRSNTVLILFGVAIILLSIFIRPAAYKNLPNMFNELYVTTWQPQEMEEAARWLRSSQYSEEAIVLTEMGGTVWYLPLFFPELSTRWVVIAPYSEREYVDYFLEHKKPKVLVTNDGDDNMFDLSQSIMGTNLTEEDLIYRQGSIRMYKLFNNLP